MWKFIKSSSSKENWLNHNQIEVALIGRSNVGKSSLINALSKNNKLAKTSKTPGRTQLINYFENENGLLIIDLPGYGFANISLEKQEKMFEMVDEYFRKNHPKYVFLLIDSRRGIMEKDEEIIEYLKELKHNIIFIITKTDKAKQSELVKCLKNDYFRSNKYFLASINNEKQLSQLRDFINSINK